MITTPATSSARRVSVFRRFAGTRSTQANVSTVPPNPRISSRERPSDAVVVVGAVELIVSVELTEAALLTPTEAGESEHVTGSTAPAGELETAQLSATLPVNPPAGVTAIEVVLPVVAPAATVIAPPAASTIAGCTVTTTCVVVEAVTLPVAASAPATVRV
jgi:hypothetical protein